MQNWQCGLNKHRMSEVCQIRMQLALRRILFNYGKTSERLSEMIIWKSFMSLIFASPTPGCGLEPRCPAARQHIANNRVLSVLHLI